MNVNDTLELNSFIYLKIILINKFNGTVMLIMK